MPEPGRTDPPTEPRGAQAFLADQDVAVTGTPDKPITGPDAAFQPGSTSFRVGRIAMAAVLLISYAVVLAAYAQSTLGAGINQRVAPPNEGVSLQFVPTALDASAATMAGVMYVLPGAGLADESGRLRQDLSVHVLPVLGAGSVTYPAGQVPTPLNLLVSASGSVREYPFDDYATSIVSSVETRSSDTSPWTTVPVVVGAESELGGWALSFSTPGAAAIGGNEFRAADGYGIQALGARRALSTIALAIVLLLFMVLSAVMTAFVARAVVLQHRRVEPSLAGWMGAVLFALVPLRNFLPGAPPLGSWIDVLIFFWVEIVIMLALAVYVATWLRDGPPSDRSRA